MRMYMVYDNYEGQAMGVSLVFAHTAKEAKQLAYKRSFSLGTTEYIDMRAKWLKDETRYNYLRKLCNSYSSHIIDSPPGCAWCGAWVNGELNINNMCADCVHLTS